MMDLLGADLPAEDGAAGDFRWADGPLLTAIKVRSLTRFSFPPACVDIADESHANIYFTK
jgi:hypothetical protein